jgi:hypothetical protein
MGAVAGGGQDHGKKGDAHDEHHPVRKLADMGSKSMRRHLHPSSFSLIFFVALLLCILDKTRLLVSSLTKLFNFSFLFSFSDILLSASSLDLPPNISLPLVFSDFLLLLPLFVLAFLLYSTSLTLYSLRVHQLSALRLVSSFPPLFSYALFNRTRGIYSCISLNNINVDPCAVILGGQDQVH